MDHDEHNLPEWCSGGPLQEQCHERLSVLVFEQRWRVWLGPQRLLAWLLVPAVADEAMSVPSSLAQLKLAAPPEGRHLTSCEVRPARHDKSWGRVKTHQYHLQYAALSMQCAYCHLHRQCWL